MRVYCSGRRLVVVLALVVAAAGASLTAAKQTFWRTSLTATFRCAFGTACATGDRLLADGLGAYVGNLQTTEGAFINANGGFSIHELPGGSTPERSVVIDLSARKVGDVDGPCGVTPASLLLAATDAELRLNVEGPNDSVVGIENLPEDIAVGGFGILNYRDPAQPNVIWTLRWETGDVLITKDWVNPANVRQWQVSSSGPAEALLQCTIQKGRIQGGDKGTYIIPFSILVTKP